LFSVTSASQADNTMRPTSLPTAGVTTVRHPV
jgi:hypothetical protein